MALLIRAKDIGEGANVLETLGPNMSTKMIYGNDSNLMVATRPGGYHSKPHIHDSEQLNYVTAGEIWVFIGESGFLARAGDFYRVPRNAVHWGWVAGDEPCTIVESHAPAVDPAKRKAAVGLFDEGETPDLSTAVGTFYTDTDAAAIEAKVLGPAKP